MSMKAAYRVAEELIKDRLKESAPDALREIEDLSAADIIVTTGGYDHIEDVFGQGGIPCTVVNPQAMDRASLRSDQVTFVNCPGQFSAAGLRALRQFVEQGGFLFTTDWALTHVIEKAFPGYIEYNQRATQDEVVRVEILQRDDLFLGSLIGPNDDPQWWLEGSSYPIRVLDSSVQVLVSSRELGEKYGEPAVFVSFGVGEGRVYHMISHFYLQRTETRTARHRTSAYAYLAEKGIATADFGKYAGLGADESDLGSVESALTSRSLLSSVLLEKAKHRTRTRREQDENA
jgi:hypothetical protein